MSGINEMMLQMVYFHLLFRVICAEKCSAANNWAMLAGNSV
jgi:glycosylphosphatidylinositol transamidase (GPIT) subunit GPI8